MTDRAFHPTIRRWFKERFDAPSPPQERGWPEIRAGRHTLIAAPTGTGKTLAAFLWAIDELVRQGDALADATQVLYVSPLKALGNDVQKNLEGPLAELRLLDPALPEVRVLVRSGDTLPAARAAMRKRPPHILVTTPESLYILLTSDSGRAMLRSVRTVIVDEIHAVAGDKRGAHLALSLERLEALVAGADGSADAPGGTRLQRIGLSATQKPIEEVARLLVGAGRDCALVDVGHRRDIDLAIEVPESPLATVCSHETWQEIYNRVAGLIRAHRTTLVFVNTRKMAERVAARLTEALGKEVVTSHHGSLALDRRLDAEQRLKAGTLKALVATASLELGIDIGDVDLVVQIGVTPSIAVLLQRVGRSGHALSRRPKGRLFPLTRDELVCAAALMHAIRKGDLDRTRRPGRPLDILAQQIVAACVPEAWEEEALFHTLTRAWPYRDLARADFDAVVQLHGAGRQALLHRDGVRGRLRSTRRARITALTSGGAIPDTADYQVVLEPEATPVGSVHEDFAVEANAGDIFQLGNASWRILKVEPGRVRVADAQGAPPTIPFWIAEGPQRTRELSAAVAAIRLGGADPDWLRREAGLDDAAATQLADYLAAGARALGAVPTQDCVVLERFFDESGGMQLVVHAPFGGRINRAWGLALRKRFCRGFGFELQAAANEEAIVLSLGPQHSFGLDEVFDYLHPDTARDVLIQALLPAPIFAARWRWNLGRSLLLSRTRGGGQRVPAPLQRMRADDMLAQAFPQVMACGETLPPGDIPIPWDHPIVRQTIEDCLEEALDAEGLIELLRGLRDGRIKRVAIDTPEPSPFALGILNAAPYAFLDDAPLEERRTQAVLTRRALDPGTADTLGALDPQAVARVREEAWPQPENAEEVHEALLWMGYVTDDEARASGWREWLDELRDDRRVMSEETTVPGTASGGIRGAGAGEPARARWFAAESTREPKAMLRGRLEAQGPVPAGPDDEALLLELENDGVVLRCRLEGRQVWCERRLLARIQRYTLETLRREIEPVSAATYWRFLACWQHADEAHRLEGPRGVAEVVRQLAGFEIPAAAWEAAVLPARVRGYRPDWLDQITLTGEVVWGRLWGAGDAPARTAPVCLLPRDEFETWLALSAPPAASGADLSSRARAILEVLSARGALFTQELERATGMLPTHLNLGLTELCGRGLLTCDSWSGLRRLIKPARDHRRFGQRPPFIPAGRWSLLRPATAVGSSHPGPADPRPFERETAARRDAAAFVVVQLFARYGVLFRRILAREKVTTPWRDLVRVCREMELRGTARGGRFVAGFAGEQYALPEAVELLRRVRKRDAAAPLSVAASDPLNLQGILTPDERVPSQARRRVRVA